MKQWSEMISAAEHRMKAVQNSLQHETTHDSGLASLCKKYARILPKKPWRPLILTLPE